MFKSWSLQTKMISAFMVGAIMLVVVGGIGFHTRSTIVEKYDAIANQVLPNIVLAAGLRATSRNIEFIVTRLAMENINEASLQKLRHDFDEAVALYLKKDKAYQDIPFVAGEQEKYDAQNDHWKKVWPIAKKMIELTTSKSPNAKTEFLVLLEKEFYPEVEAQLDGLTKLIAFQEEVADKSREAAATIARTGNIISTAAITLGFVLSLFIGFTFSRLLSRALDGIANRLGIGAEQVAAASKQISSAGAEFSSSATEQAASLQETVSSVDEISAMVNKNADNAKRSQEYSSRSHDSATKGKQAVEEMISSIDDINRSNTEIMAQIEASNREISEIVKVISEIGNKTKVINDIVFQTKLLSFNASVEAARAGEHGKGFAVVAEEVGNLAQMSGNAAKEISEMLGGSIQKVEGIVNDTKTKVEKLVVSGKQKVEAGTMTAKNCGSVLDEIVANVSEMNQMIKEIATASHEQSQGVQEITKAMQQLDHVTQQNAAVSQESANAAESLAVQAGDLHHMVEVLVETVQGAGGKTKPTPVDTHADRKVLKMAKRSEKKNKKLAKETMKLQKAAGAEDMPAENDPRFEEI